ncbi:MAG: BatA domain-containing protein [Gemmatimonadota bacterium]|nr:BatA domain-containing protein [Gemmatimonadota bacterium]
MTFLASWALWVAGAVSAAVIALHILASKNPRVVVLPTTRFIPDMPLRATARALRLSDVLLLMLRVAVVMLVGVAVARPELTRARRSVGRAVLVDRSWIVNRQEARDSATRYYETGDLLFVYDSAAYQVRGKDPLAYVSAERIFSPDPRGSLSAALAAAIRDVSELRGEADSVEIVLISSLSAEQFDNATSAIRALWPGRIRIVRLNGLGGFPVQTYRDVFGASSDDPVRAAVSFATHLDMGHIKTDSVRIDRRNPVRADTTWTQHGLTLVRWPASLDSSGYPRRARVDTAGAVMAQGDGRQVVVVSPFVRAVDPPPGIVVARWADGSPAATERKMMHGCVRDVAIPLPSRGDLALREGTRRLVAALTRQCGAVVPPSNVSDSTLDMLRGSGPLVATRALESRTASPGHLTTWLLAAALALFLLEPLLRRPRVVA